MFFGVYIITIFHWALLYLFFFFFPLSYVQARPMFKDRNNFPQMVDPALRGQYPKRGLYQALAISAMCVQEQPTMRPSVTDVVMALNYLASQKYDPNDPIHHSKRGHSSPQGDRTRDTKRDDDKRNVDTGADKKTVV